jgi:hypothetical protein
MIRIVDASGLCAVHKGFPVRGLAAPVVKREAEWNGVHADPQPWVKSGA